MKDSIGQEIKIGDVCSHFSRHSSSMYSDPIIVRKFTVDGRVQGTKFEKNYLTKLWESRNSKPVLPERLTVTGLTEPKLSDMLSKQAG